MFFAIRIFLLILPSVFCESHVCSRCNDLAAETSVVASKKTQRRESTYEKYPLNWQLVN